MATQRYTIQSGDTLSGLAKKNSTTVDDLLKLNPSIKDRTGNMIYAGAGLDIGRYTPPNPTTTPTPATTPTPTPSAEPITYVDQAFANSHDMNNPYYKNYRVQTPAVTRYTNPYDEAAAAADAAKITTFTASDANAIREEKRRNAQAQIDSINQASDINRADTEQQNLQNSGRTRAILSNAGIIGTGRGLEKTTSTETFNKKQLASVEAERSAKINAILADVEDKASQEIAAKRLEAQGNMNAHLEFLKGNVESAKSNVKNLAQLATKGGTIEENLDAKDIEDIMRQTGYSKLELDSIWNGNLPESTKTTYQDVTTQNSSGNAVLTRIGINPVTGKTTKTEYDLGVPYGDVAKGTIEKYGKDGLMIVYPNGTHKVLVGGGSTSNAPGTVTNSNASLSEFPADIQAAAQSISDGKSKLNEYPSAKRLQINAAMSKIYTAAGGNELAQGAYDSVTNLEKHPGFSSAIGTNLMFGLGKNIAGTKSAGFIAELDKLKANLKLVNIKYLKGTGQLSDAEGKTLEDASTTLSPNLPEKDFKAELDRVKAALLKASNVKVEETTPTNNNPIPKGTDGTEYGYPGYESDGTQWVLKQP